MDIEDVKILTRVETKMDSLCKEFKAYKKEASGDGFTRCATRAEQIKSLRQTVKWLRNTFYCTGFITLIVGVVMLVAGKA
jgi:hypothetical protein